MKKKNKLKPVITEDGSYTIFNEAVGEHYHSTFGALQESEHIFIRAGLEPLLNKQNTIHVLEMGFGTGLNALLTFLHADKTRQKIYYHGLEAFPIDTDTAKTLNYHQFLHVDQELFLKFHGSEPRTKMSDNFLLEKEIGTLEKAVFPDDRFDIVYFDAFSPEVQPELWTQEIFRKIYRSMKRGSTLTTYSCKGIVKRAMKEAGFEIEKLPGPPGKREFLRVMK